MTPRATQALPGGRTAIYMEKAGHYRTLDTLGLLLKRRKIDQATHDAGTNFAEDFVAAQLGGAHAIDYAKRRKNVKFSLDQSGQLR